MLVKICGISNSIDAFSAVVSGADALGFVMGGNVLPAEVEPHAQTIREIIKQIPGNVDTYVVTHLTKSGDIVALADYVRSSGIQVSEDIGVEELRKIRKATKKKIMKTIVVEGERGMQKLLAYQEWCDYLLLN